MNNNSIYVLSALSTALVEHPLSHKHRAVFVLDLPLSLSFSLVELSVVRVDVVDFRHTGCGPLCALALVFLVLWAVAGRRCLCVDT